MSQEFAVVIRDSVLKGRGVFAGRNFKKGEVVLGWNPLNKVLSEYDLQNVSEEEKKYIGMFDGRYVLIAEPGRYINHSCDPNTQNGAHGFEYALRDIEKGEEITSDYSLTGGPFDGFDCVCGSARCRTYISSAVSLGS